MNSKIYGKLAVTNLKNNKKSYIPYILASAFSVMMYFTMDNLYRNRSQNDSSRLSENVQDPRKINIPWVFSFCQNL